MGSQADVIHGNGRFVFVVFMRISEEDLRQRQSLPLDVKVRMTESAVRAFVNEYGEDNVYVSFSGGKDSTVLLHIVRKLYPDILAVFLDTWMEYPKIREFVKGFHNVKVIKPEYTLKEIIARNGWCFPSKDVSEMIEAARRGMPWAIRKLNGLDKDGNPSEYRQQYIKWQLLLDAPGLISSGCCIDMKEKPVMKFEKETGRHPIMAIMADESARRKEAYLRTGCNTFDTKIVVNEETGEEEEVRNERPMSKPMGFWTEQDVLAYIVKENLDIAEPYGQIVEVGQVAGQYNLFDNGIGCCEECQYKTTKESRTGCMFCMVGCHLDKFAKFKRLKVMDIRLFNHIMYDLGGKEMLEWIDANYCDGKGLEDLFKDDGAAA